MQLSEKARNIKPSLTLAISTKASKMKDEGIKVIGFGAGEPDFQTPDYIKKAAHEAIDKGLTHYTPTAGTEKLRRAIQRKFLEDNDLEYSLNEIIVSNGAKHSLFNTLQTIVDRGEEVVIPRPYWVSYPEMVKMAGGKPVYTTCEENLKLNIKNLSRVLTPATRAIILNSPSNPAGIVYTKRELIEIEKLVVDNDLYVISDEIYEHLIYENIDHVSIASLGEEIKRRTIVINGMSKAFAMTGWRIGYAAGNEEVINKMASIQSHSTSNPNSIAQYASAIGLNDREEARKAIMEMKNSFLKRRNYMVDRVKDIEGITCKIPDGAFYLLVNIKEVIENTEISGSMDFAERLISEEKVAVVPGLAFGVDDFVRLSYATSMEKIEKGLNRIGKFVSYLKN